jgi:hypothetical protein
LRSYKLADSSRPYFQGWIEALSGQARAEGTGDVRPMQFNNSSAMGMDVTYYRGDADDPRRGRAVYLFGDSKTFFISLTAGSALFGELEEIVSTMRIEP